MRSKLGRVALALLLSACLLPVGGLSAFAQELSVPATVEGQTVTITTLDDFRQLQADCTYDAYSKGKVVQLEADLDLSSLDDCQIAYFAGTFQGNGHTLSGVSVNSDGANRGLFRFVAAGAVVEDLTVQGSVTPGGTATNVGGVAGQNDGTICRCAFDGQVSGLESVGGIAGVNGVDGVIQDCTVQGSVEGEHEVGGLVGSNLGAVANCTNQASVNNQAVVSTKSFTFDLATLTEDDFVSIANIGGVAGQSTGRVEGCENAGSVGYEHMGYNVGGIVGKSSGFVQGSTNRGAINGRQDVGGIVGQLVPSQTWVVSDNKLDQAKAQVAALSSSVASLSDRVSNLSVDSDEFTAASQKTIQELKRLADQLDVELDLETYYNDTVENGSDSQGSTSDGSRLARELQNAASQLRESASSGSDVNFTPALEAITDLMSSSQAITSDAAGQMSDVMASLQGVAAQLTTLMGLMADAASGDASVPTADEVVNDISFDQAYSHSEGAVSDCVSQGAIAGDTNVGGVVGTCSFELAIDVSNQVDASDYLFGTVSDNVFAAIRNCQWMGQATAKKEKLGGIVGECDYGTVVDCLTMGSLECADGAYVGGIAGTSNGSVCQSYARVQLEGASYVGGIAGKSAVLTDCASCAFMEKGEYVGAVAGEASGDVSGCRYVNNGVGGIDGIGYEGKAWPVSYADLMADDAVPQAFKEIYVSFVADGVEVARESVEFGGSVDHLPEMPQQGQSYWKWNDFNSDAVYYSQVVEGSYVMPLTTLSSGEEVEQFLVEGTFYEGQHLQVRQWNAEGATLPEKDAAVLGAYTLSVSDYSDSLVVRARMEAGRLYVLETDGSWRQADCTQDGSYAVFTIPNGSTFVMLTNAAPIWPWVLGGVVAVALIGGGAAVVLRKRKRANAPSGDEAQVEEEAAHAEPEESLVG